MHRPLCPTETIYVAQRSRAVLSCSVRGNLDEELLGAAFAAQLARHPALRCRIAGAVGSEAGAAAGAFVLEPLTAAELPELVVRRWGPDLLAAEFNTPLPVGGPLVRAVLQGVAGEYTLVLSVDHTVTDGLSALALLNSLWQSYAELAEGRPLPERVPDGDGPSPVTELLPAVSEQELEAYLAQRIERAGRHRAAFLPYAAKGAEPAPGAARLAFRRLLLTAESTTRLRRAARAVGVSVHGLVAAAALLAVQRALGPGPLTLGCLSPVDLRPFLVPALSPEVMVAAVASYLDTLEVSAETDPGELARQVNDHLHASIDRGDFLRELRIMPRLAEHPALLAASVIVTNMGALSGPRSPYGVEVTDVRLVPARENYHPEAGRGPLMVCVVTVDGCLDIELPYSRECFTDQQTAAVVADIRRVLDGFAHPVDPADSAA